MKTRETIAGTKWIITSPNGCTVKQNAGKTTIAIEVPANVQTLVVAQTSELEISDDDAVVTEVFDLAPVVGGSGGSALSATGEKFGNMIFEGVDDGATVTIEGKLTVKHATWFDNSLNASTVRVIPAAWKNEVMTCYLKTAVPVELSGVTWVNEAPEMLEGYTHVIAVQQIAENIVLANLAYSV